MADSVNSTQGHENEKISVQGLKAAFQKFKTDVVDTIMGPTYDAGRECVVFPTTSKVRYDAERECVVFG